MAESWTYQMRAAALPVLRQCASSAEASASAADLSTVRIHLVVMREPFLTLLLDGTKSIESRFSRRRQAPFERVSTADLLLLKAVSGPVVGIAEVGKTWYIRKSDSWDNVRRRFARRMCAEDDDFWTSRAAAEYASLLEITKVTRIEPIRCGKIDRRGWVVLPESSCQTSLLRP